MNFCIDKIRNLEERKVFCEQKERKKKLFTRERNRSFVFSPRVADTKQGKTCRYKSFDRGNKFD